MRFENGITNDFNQLKDFLDFKVEQYNRPNFIPNDPICIPHQYKLKQDIEIAAFFAAILAWGQRKTIINKCNELFLRMDNQPYDFMLNHSDDDLKGLLGFKHRTFNDTDLFYFVSFFKHHYLQSDTLETAFLPQQQIFNSAYLPEKYNDESYVEVSSSPCALTDFKPDDFTAEKALNHFRSYFFSLPDFPRRTFKHISSPLQKSTCKRLNMFLRWMVRKDNCGVDFGIWNTIPTSALICPCDVHVDRVGRLLGLIKRKQTDWLTAVELTENLMEFDANDPVKYDFALFGLGVEGEF
ncbi:TIGR02757 family protein [Pedobacter cryotolerans]|uniref:TIGR02757 family protein n=1 Tax=Pedobacter cryotolerans TaxID=2571270 RepID=A0A4U1CCH0_9SPHI|nr:TIGR02757 family protein [Pedobacter cryotolerans]TKC01510.1 TIGR02757 family protein [Pedobacter cryotolerans]